MLDVYLVGFESGLGNEDIIIERVLLRNRYIWTTVLWKRVIKSIFPSFEKEIWQDIWPLAIERKALVDTQIPCPSHGLLSNNVPTIRDAYKELAVPKKKERVEVV